MTDVRPRRRRLVPALSMIAMITVLASACTSSPSGAPAGTDVVTAPPTSASTGAATVTVPSSVPAGTSSAAPTSATPSSTSSSSSSSTPAPLPQVTTVPTHQAGGVSPVEPVTVQVAAGTLRSVTLENASTGTKVAGKLAADGRSWSVTPELGYDQTYRLTSVVLAADGRAGTTTTEFSTVAPSNRTDATVFPNDGRKVGVGQPVAITFDEPIADRAAAEAAITVTATPKQEGAFRWISDTEVRWRPKDYWKAGSKVSVAVDVYGVELGDGLYGQQDEKVSFTVGDALIATVDDDTKMMVVTRNGTKIKEMPVSLGSDKYPSYNGVHVVAEAYDEKIMDSSTWGLTGPGAYRTRVEWAVRISSTGEFVHAAPWSVEQQGNTNVSHGCVNMSTENAKWFYDTFTRGDIVDVKNTVGPPLEVWDGYGDWQLSWDEYRA
jgi:lipoprotein-anchoring transpeptidase ErfK/SrfK